MLDRTGTMRALDVNVAADPSGAMIARRKRPEAGDRREAGPILPLVPIDPVPIKVRVIEEEDAAYVARVWREGDSDRCRLCPRAHCGVSRVPGLCDLCLVRIDKPVPSGVPVALAPVVITRDVARGLGLACGPALPFGLPLRR